MKKIFLSFSLLALVLTGTVSCSSDDNSTEQKHTQTLELKSLKGNTVNVDEEVTFMIAVGTTAIEGAQLYVNGKDATNPFKFTEMGTFKVVAKKEGYKESNELTIEVKKAVADISLVNTWVPTHVNVNIPMADPIAMPYPKKENCEDDTLVFDDAATVKFNYHDDSCAVSTTGTTWSFNEATKVLTFTLFDQVMNVNVTSLTADKFTIKAKGDQFAALIPILVPDLASSLPPAMLALIEVELQFDRQ
ncbi:hypothetical protein [Myroides sp. WP-1]|uniref:hypothetical protein n=1 Tax=Myroides sp. WP-1 TaxID=2759944 RepID=UPI0015F796B5|nr:hypothetical protein [Myroides sp. WP-1]MBB1139414.1 hypothetical protein [Myroides sp. WP-1]